MKIIPKNVGIFIPHFESYMITKDVGQIVYGFIDLGHTVTIYTLSSSIDINTQEYSIQILSKKQLTHKTFWDAQKIDTIICYTWLSARYTPLIEVLSQTTLKILIKLDSDGRLGYPLRPSYLRGAGYWTNIYDFLHWSIRSLQWLYPIGHFHRRRLKQIDLSDKTIIESPMAKENLVKVLQYWNKKILAEKIHIIPNPVTQDIIDSPLPSHKEKLVVSIGRWHDRSKNRELLKKVLRKVSNTVHDYIFSIIGTNTSYFSSEKNLKLIEQISHDELTQKYLSRARILFIPSRWEGFNLSASEAVCSGMSVVGGPLECLYYLSNDNTSGTIASSNTTQAVQKALLSEIAVWEQGIRNPVVIATYWRSKLNRKTIVSALIS